MTNKFIEPMEFDDENSKIGFIDDDKKPTLIKPMEFDTPTKSVEEKMYIILYIIATDDSNEIDKTFSICIGRTEAYNDIKDKLISGFGIDIYKSKILTETKQTDTKTGDRKYYLLPEEDWISVYSFCKTVEEFYSDSDFNIEDYNDDYIEEEDSKDLSSESRFYLTAEQKEYKKLLDEAIKRESFLSQDINNIKNI